MSENQAVAVWLRRLADLVDRGEVVGSDIIQAMTDTTTYTVYCPLFEAENDSRAAADIERLRNDLGRLPCARPHGMP